MLHTRRMCQPCVVLPCCGAVLCACGSARGGLQESAHHAACAAVQSRSVSITAMVGVHLSLELCCNSLLPCGLAVQLTTKACIAITLLPYV